MASKLVEKLCHLSSFNHEDKFIPLNSLLYAWMAGKCQAENVQLQLASPITKGCSAKAASIHMGQSSDQCSLFSSTYGLHKLPDKNL